MKIGFISMPLAGHLNPMTALARKLQSRGHEIVFIGVPDAGPTVRAAGLNFVSYCAEEFPAGACASALAAVAKIHGMEATRWTIGGAGRAFFQAASQHLPRDRSYLRWLGCSPILTCIYTSCDLSTRYGPCDLTLRRFFHEI